MRELNCVVTPSSRGWLLIVGSHHRGWFPSKDGALQAAIAEAQRSRTCGVYSSVKVQHGTDQSRSPSHRDGRRATHAAAGDAPSNGSDR